MSDPFVQRMMARAQARKTALGRVNNDTPNKENYGHVSPIHESKISNVHRAKSPRLACLDETLSPVKPALPSKPILSSLDANRSRSPIKINHNLSTKNIGNYKPALHTSPKFDSHLDGNFDEHSSRRTRFSKLSKRTQEMNEWEDDYTYHTHLKVTKQVEEHAEKVALPLTDNSMHDLNDSTKHSTNNGCNEKKYYYGSPSLSTAKDNSTSCLAAQSNSPRSLASLLCNSPHKLNEGSCSLLPNCSNRSPGSVDKSLNLYRKSPRSKCKEKVNLPVSSPTRKLKWDRKLISSLEAQGFTPTDSKSKLFYDFEKDNAEVSKKNDKEEQRNLNVASSSQITDHNLNSFGHSPSKDNRRDSSPSKVKDLHGMWEQHIRENSPDRQDVRMGSISPVRKMPVMDHKREPSPAKLFGTYDIDHIPRSKSPTKPYRARSPEKNYRSASPIKSYDVNVVSPSMTCRPHSPSKNYCRPQSPTNPPVEMRSASPVRNIPRQSSQSENVEVIKGVAPMPETRPLVRDPSRSSVREKAAAFNSIIGSSTPKIDPAELSLKDRRNMFEKKKGEALIPKAPFGQSVSEKILYGSTTKSTKEVLVPTNLPKEPTPVKPKLFPRPQVRAASKAQQENDANNFQSKRHHFENVEDNWQDNEINSKTLKDRSKDMEVLLNRFKKPKGSESLSTSHKAIQDDSSSDSDESNTSEPSTYGPPKPPRLYIESSPPMPPPLPPSTRSFNRSAYSPCSTGSNSPSKRLNSTEVDDNRSNRGSPRKEYVPKVKDGCLFPSLSDIESHSEAVESTSEEEMRDSSFAESVFTSASVDSLGAHIQRMAQGISTDSSKMLGTITEQISYPPDSMGSTTMEAIGAIDDALDEAMFDETPTPPKRALENGPSSSYKTPRLGNEPEVFDSENNLMHTISMYRKQRPPSVPCTPVRQMPSMVVSPAQDSPVSPWVNISAKIRHLNNEEDTQLSVISQASAAISVVADKPELKGSSQHVEAEKVLLVASQKRQTISNEIQRLKAEGALNSRMALEEESCTGSISIKNITIHLKKDFINKGSKDIHHLIVLVKHRENVITSQLQTMPSCISMEGDQASVKFANLISLHDLTADFIITLEVYCLKVDSPNQNLKSTSSRMRLTPLKRLKNESRISSPCVQSPCGPYSVRSTSFSLIGFAHININNLTRNAWNLEKVPFASPLDGHLIMQVTCTMDCGVSETSFLTIQEDVGGFPAWNRRYCRLGGNYMKYWLYPEDSEKKDCMGYLDLRMCTSRKVELVSRDICTRQHTFQLTLIRTSEKGDKTDLVHEVRNNIVISKYLLSADSKEERIMWCNKLNKALANIRAWDLDALKPEDFHV